MPTRVTSPPSSAQAGVPVSWPRREVLELLKRDDRWTRTLGVLNLSLRERQIVDCFMAGIDDENGIASCLAMSRHTVHTHVDRLYKKLGVSSRAQVIVHLFVTYCAISTSGLAWRSQDFVDSRQLRPREGLCRCPSPSHPAASAPPMR